LTLCIHLNGKDSTLCWEKDSFQESAYNPSMSNGDIMCPNGVSSRVCMLTTYSASPLASIVKSLLAAIF
jgi:hypothetical protein